MSDIKSRGTIAPFAPPFPTPNNYSTRKYFFTTYSKEIKYLGVPSYIFVVVDEAHMCQYTLHNIVLFAFQS